MPLSEHEQRLLEQMERALSAEDPRFASALRGSNARAPHRRRIILSIFGVVIGMVALVVAVILNEPIVGVLAFLVMLAAVLLGVMSWRSVPPPGQLGVVGRNGTVRAPGTPRPRPKRNLMSRFEERWDRRRDNDR